MGLDTIEINLVLDQLDTTNNLEFDKTQYQFQFALNYTQLGPSLFASFLRGRGPSSIKGFQLG